VYRALNSRTNETRHSFSTVLHFGLPRYVSESHCLKDTFHRIISHNTGTRKCSWLTHRAKSQNIAGLIPRASLEFFIDLSFRPQYGPGVDLASNVNEYQEYLMEE
jgi:hypothetical protein